MRELVINQDFLKLPVIEGMTGRAVGSEAIPLFLRQTLALTCLVVQRRTEEADVEQQIVPFTDVLYVHPVCAVAIRDTKGADHWQVPLSQEQYTELMGLVVCLENGTRLGEITSVKVDAETGVLLSIGVFADGMEQQIAKEDVVSVLDNTVICTERKKTSSFSDSKFKDPLNAGRERTGEEEDIPALINAIQKTLGDINERLSTGTELAWNSGGRMGEISAEPAATQMPLCEPTEKEKRVVWDAYNLHEPDVGGRDGLSPGAPMKLEAEETAQSLKELSQEPVGLEKGRVDLSAQQGETHAEECRPQMQGIVLEKEFARELAERLRSIEALLSELVCRETVQVLKSTEPAAGMASKDGKRSVEAYAAGALFSQMPDTVGQGAEHLEPFVLKEPETLNGDIPGGRVADEEGRICLTDAPDPFEMQPGPLPSEQKTPASTPPPPPAAPPVPPPPPAAEARPTMPAKGKGAGLFWKTSAAQSLAMLLFVGAYAALSLFQIL